MKELVLLNQDLVREHIKAAARDAAFIGAAESQTHKASVRNPLCGDEIEVSTSIDAEDRIQNLKAQIRGCLVARAAWSLLAPRVQGLTRTEAIAFLNSFESELDQEASGPTYSELPAPLSSLLTYRSPSPRHSCATLGSHALLQALQPKNCNQ